MSADTSNADTRKIIISTHYMLGNTGIQLAVAHILAKLLGHNDIITLDYNESTTTNKHNGLIVFECLEDTWPSLYPFLDQGIPPRHSDIKSHNIYLGGYFQHSEPLVKHRDSILEWFAHCDMKVSSKGTTMKEIMEAQPRLKPDSHDIVLHVRLRDFVHAKLVIDPAPQLAILRKELKDGCLIIICEKPSTTAEHNYLKLFEEFNPIIRHGTELEDFAILRAANRIMVSNSTFSWLAAFVGAATQRWIPVPTYNELGKINEATDVLYEASSGYPIEQLDIPVERFLPVTGEFLQSLCDYTILDSTKKDELHMTIDYAHPLDRQIFIEEPLPLKVLEARSLFIYPTSDSRFLKHVFKAVWPNLRLIVLHNSDYGVDYKSVIPFLEENPNVWCWAQNATQWHPRIRCVPILEENRMWRGGNAEYEPTITVSRNKEREIEIFVPFMSNTNPIRGEWMKQLLIARESRLDIQLFPRLQKSDYLDTLQQSRAMVCAPGNGVDTHRHWEALLKGAWAIVHDSPHTRLLMRTYPSLHLLPVYDMEELLELEIPHGLPPFHPMLLRGFWRTLYRTHA